MTAAAPAPAPAAARQQQLAPKAMVLKKRPTTSDLAVKKARHQAQVQKNKPQRKSKSQRFLRAERIVKEAVATENEQVRLNRALGLTNAPQRRETPEMGSLCFVFRIRANAGTTEQTQRVLNLLRLGKPYSGVFLEFNESTVQMLRLVDPYVCYGTPSLKNVKDLIYKRAYCQIEAGGDKDGGEERRRVRVPVVDNTLVEKQLEDVGLICVEDVVQEIVQCDTKARRQEFKRAVRFLAPFDLSAPSDGSSLVLMKQEKVLSGFQPQNKLVDLISKLV